MKWKDYKVVWNFLTTWQKFALVIGTVLVLVLLLGRGPSTQDEYKSQLSPNWKTEYKSTWVTVKDKDTTTTTKYVCSQPENGTTYCWTGNSLNKCTLQNEAVICFV